MYKNVQITRQKGFSEFNLLTYKKRAGIAAMFPDYKSGSYNLEGSKANIARLTNLILLIAIADQDC